MLATALRPRGATVKTTRPVAADTGQWTPRVQVVDLSIPIQERGFALSLEDKEG